MINCCSTFLSSQSVLSCYLLSEIGLMVRPGSQPAVPATGVRFLAQLLPVRLQTDHQHPSGDDQNMTSGEEINNNNPGHWQYISVYDGVDYPTVITVFCVKTNNTNVRPRPALYLVRTASRDVEQEKLC